MPTIALHLMQHLCAALASSAAGFVYRVTGPFDSSMNTSTRTQSDIRTIYADTVEHARLFKSISSVQRYYVIPTPLSMLDCLKVYREWRVE